MGKRETNTPHAVVQRVYAVLQRIIEDNPDTDWSVIKDQFWRTVENDRPDLLRALFRALFDQVLADWHKDHFEAEHEAESERDLGRVSRGYGKPKLVN
jgi:hypothetical protein